MEKQIRSSMLSLFDIVVEEGSQVSDSAPQTFIQTAEDARQSIAAFFKTSGDYLLVKSTQNPGLLSFGYTVGAYVLFLLKFICTYIITFYPFIIFLVYSFFTSKIFKKDDFSYDPI